MAKAKNQTVETKVSVASYLNTIKDAKRREDFSAIIDMVTENTGYEAKMWGPAIVGFGSYDYKYESGREGRAPLAGLASRANAIALYISASFDKREELLLKFGKYKSEKGCVYIQKLEDIDTGILIKLFKKTIEHRKKLYPG